VKPVYVFDAGVIGFLYSVALWCRNPEVRRQAISLLRQYPRREGLWHSQMEMTVASWVMSKEEEGLVAGVVPRTVRLKVEMRQLFLCKRKVILTCSKFDVNLEEWVEIPLVTLTW